MQKQLTKRVQSEEDKFITEFSSNTAKNNKPKGITLALSSDYANDLDQNLIELIKFSEKRLNRSDIVKASLQSFFTLTKEEQLELINKSKK